MMTSTRGTRESKFHLKYPAMAPALSHPPANIISNSDFPAACNFCAPPTRNECPENGLPTVPITPCRRLSMRDIEPPFAQDKLVRVSRGAILDFVVDLRKYSKTFGRSLAVEVSAEKFNQLLVPLGFAHGLITLEDATEVHYKVSNFYSPKHDKGILWSDPELNIDWGIETTEALASPRDRAQSRLSKISSPF